MESHGADPRKTPASYADFSDAEEQGGWLKTAVQFFAIPMLIVVLAIGIYMGVRATFGGGPSTTAEFVEMLQSNTVKRRWHAAMELQARANSGGIGEFRNDSIRLALESALEKARQEKQDPPQMALMTLSLLGRVGMPESIPAVRAALDDPHPWTRSYAIRVLGMLGDEASRPRFEEFAASDDPGTRQVALATLAELDRRPPAPPGHLGARTRELLRAALGDRHEDVRFTAALILAKSGEGAAALPVLRTMLDRSYLEKLVPAKDVDTRLAVIDRYTLHTNVILRAMAALQDLDAARSDPEVVTAIRKLTDSDAEGDSAVRERARKVLAEWNLGA